jgi:DoxX-like family
MTARNIGYWSSTALVALAFAGGGMADLAHPASMIEIMKHLGYPGYFMSILGTWKLLGAAAVLAPGLPRLKEWAYAGMAFDLTGASLSHAISGDALANVATPLFLLALVATSWALRSGARAWPSANTAEASNPTQRRGKPRVAAAA